MSDPNPTASRKEREYASHHQDILEAAMHLFAEGGYQQTTMQMVAEKAEFSVGYLYKHFPGKEQLYRELVEFHLSRLDEIIEETRGTPGTPLDQIRHSYRLVCEHFNRHPDFMRIYHEEIGSEICRLDQKKAKHHQVLEESLRAAQAQNLLRPHDASLLAAAIQGATKELIKELAKRRDENPFDPLTDLVFSLLIDPLRP